MKTTTPASYFPPPYAVWDSLTYLLISSQIDVHRDPCEISNLHIFALHPIVLKRTQHSFVGLDGDRVTQLQSHSRANAAVPTTGLDTQVKG